MKKYPALLSLLLLCCFSQATLAQQYFDFESGAIPPEITLSPGSKWRTTHHSLAGAYSMCDSVVPQNTAVSESFSFPVLPSPHISVDTFSALVKFSYGSSVTSTNRFGIFVGANLGAGDTLAFTNERLKSFVLGYVGTGSDDTLRLFYLQNKKLTSIISTKLRCNNATLAICLAKSPQGVFSLSVGANGSFAGMQTYTAAAANGFDGNHVGAHLVTSTTGYKKSLHMDNLYAAFAVRPLQVLSVQRSGARCLQVQLNKNVNALQAANTALYSLSSTGQGWQIDSVKASNGNTLQLFTNKQLISDDYVLSIGNLPAADGTLGSLTHNFSLSVLRYGDLVFSELMAHPNSEGELPEEYIELYNRTENDITLDGFTIASATKTGRITSGVIRAKSYAIIGNAPGVTPLAVSGRPTLIDAGTRLTLRDACEIPIAQLSYSDAWYADDAKKSGGWSLEKVDLNNLEESALNWRAAVDERGGTPGRANSVAAANPDLTPPACTGYKVADSRLQLDFSEALSEESLAPSSFVLDGCGAPQDLFFSLENPSSVTLVFPCQLEKNTSYFLHAENAACDLSNNCLHDFELRFGFGDKPAAGSVVINEVLFNPNTGGVDFVELYSCSDKIAELQGCRIANRKAATGAIDKSYLLPAYTLLPGEYVVITTKPDVVRAQYRCENPEAFIALPTLPAYPNESGCVTLLNADSTLLEDFYYSEKMHSGALVNKKGVSLERINPNRPASENASWLSAAQVVGFGTPTYRNSQYSTHEPSHDDAVSIYPEVFSPDGDGFDDVLFIGYKMPKEGYIANISIFTSGGKAAKTLCRNATLAVEGQLSWDGTCDNGRRADVGVYVVYVEVFSLDGKINKYKKTCVVGARF